MGKLAAYLAVGAVVLKGIIMTAIVLTLSVTFGESLALVAISALLTGVFVLGAAIITVKMTRPAAQKLEDIHQAVANGPPKR